ncbi:hypothetical protein SDC9_01555 [bioreactor metagenome]|jgi:Ca-activated chloride channel family protein|uniref:VWFA domain-containing protein n=1 Tax=bioreactor metagenome TaxID=1076179 RepID=A0A644SN63_9ZZZZ
MENFNKNIDDLFNSESKKAEENTNFPGFEKVWDKVEQKLEKKEKKRILPIWFPSGIAATLVIGLGVLYLYNQKEDLPVKPVIAQQETSPESSAKSNIINKPQSDVHKLDEEIQERIKKNPIVTKEILAYQNTSNSDNTVEIIQNIVPEKMKTVDLEYMKNSKYTTDEYYLKKIETPAVSAIPFQNQENSLSRAKTKNINELVVTAMGIKRKEQSLGYASEINVASHLQGKVAGLQISSNAPNIPNNNIVIRGVRSIESSPKPLYVIDGKPYENVDLQKISSDKIKSVNILKDNAATSLYGSRGLNGVVLIDTKGLSDKDIKTITSFSPQNNNESYDSWEENPFELSTSQPLSTFSIDVDNAAYSNIRRMINNGQIVDKNAVRVEEMINYFKYNYPQPSVNEPFSIHSEYNDCAWNPQHKILKIGLQGKTLVEKNLPSSNLVFLIDISGSMNAANKLPLLKSSFKVLLERLRPQDKVAIVTYAGNAGIALKPTSASQKEKIMTALENLQSGGSTAGAEGIITAYKLAEENFVKNGNNRVILATDGDFNVGVSNNEDLKAMIENKRKSGVFLTCLGFGMGNYKDNRLEMLADKGNGNYAYIDNIQEANKFLGKEFAGSMYAIAKDVKIQIEFNPKLVKAYRLIGYESRKLKTEDFINDKIDAGELGIGHTVTALYEVIPANSTSEFLPKGSDLKYTEVKTKDNLGNELATIKFRYKRPNEEESKELIQTVSNSQKEINSASLDFRFANAVAWFGLVLRDSQYISNKNLEDIINLAKQGKSSDEDGYRAEFIRLMESYKSIKN